MKAVVREHPPTAVALMTAGVESPPMTPEDAMMHVKGAHPGMDVTGEQPTKMTKTVQTVFPPLFFSNADERE